MQSIARLEVGVNRWDDLVDSAEDAWFYHLYHFQEALETWQSYEDASFAITEFGNGGNCLALVPCHVRGNQCLESFGGIVCHPGLGPNQRRKVRAFAYETLNEIAHHRHLERLEVRMPPLSPSLRGEKCPRVNPLLFDGFQNSLSQSYIIDLLASKDELWKRLHSNCRTHINKALSSDCSVRLADSSERDLEAYYTLHCETYQRTGVPPHPRKYFEAIWRHFVSNRRAVVFFCELDGNVIAADNEIFYKNAMSGWTAAGNAEASRIGANNLLHWHAMLWAKNHGAEYYESGEAFPGARSGKQKGLNDFKRSFGGTLYPIYKGFLNYEKLPPVNCPQERKTSRIRRLLRYLSQSLRCI